jgi:hypothetical protein
MTKSKIIDSLELYLEKIDTLKELSYYDFVKKNKVSVSYSQNVIEEGKFSINHPSIESLESFILTIRFFYQDNESCSIYNTYNNLLNLPASNDSILKYDKARNELNDFLDSVAVILNNESITYRNIIEVFIYGNLAHANNKKNRNTYKFWQDHPFTYEFRKTDFLGALNNILRFLLFSEPLIKKELKNIRIR